MGWSSKIGSTVSVMTNVIFLQCLCHLSVGRLHGLTVATPCKEKQMSYTLYSDSNVAMTEREFSHNLCNAFKELLRSKRASHYVTSKGTHSMPTAHNTYMYPQTLALPVKYFNMTHKFIKIHILHPPPPNTHTNTPGIS